MKYSLAVLAVLLVACEDPASAVKADASEDASAAPAVPTCLRTTERPKTLHCTNWYGYHEACSDWSIGYESVCSDWSPKVVSDGGIP